MQRPILYETGYFPAPALPPLPARLASLQAEAQDEVERMLRSSAI